MVDVAIQGSVCTGHDGFAPRPSAGGQSLFKVNGIPVMATGDPFPPHDKPNNPPHPGTAIGSSKVTVNGLTVAMVGDAVSCGSAIATGQPLMQVS
ncbi:PAAR domain-containing protein [Photobacterium leiognathi]|uniref:PAAR domain-containing protein n=1 Tax=Photobacterium leiognathi TaxID=553611 RepID=UPI002981A55E|nr:PAAR domain-containing protein [Photobacterium leiognathi]